MNERRPAEVLAWVDVETTGLDASHDALLQIACVMTDVNLELISDPYEAVIQHPLPDVLRERANDYVKAMHDKTGLWGKLAAGTPMGDVDQQLLQHISAVAPTPRQTRLAGNSVRLDLNFMETYLPASYGHLHYRSVDVTAIAHVMRHWYGYGDFEKKGAHTALGDILESIAELRDIRNFLTTINQDFPTAGAAL